MERKEYYKTYKEPDKYLLDFCKGKEFSYILDLGCGNGRNMKIFNKEKVVGIDTESEASKYLKGYNFVRADCRKLPFRKNSFDLIINIGLLHVLKKGLKECFKEIVRVSKVNSSLFLSWKSIERDLILKLCEKHKIGVEEYFLDEYYYLIGTLDSK